MRRAVGLLKNRPGERLGDLVGAGTDVFLICGPQEIEPLFETGLSQERRTVRSDRLQIEVLPSLQHSLLSVRDRDAVTRLVLEHVREHFQGFPHDAGAQAVARPDGR